MLLLLLKKSTKKKRLARVNRGSVAHVETKQKYRKDKTYISLKLIIFTQQINPAQLVTLSRAGNYFVIINFSGHLTPFLVRCIR